MQSLDINAQFQEALDIIEYSSDSLFLTGKAGTGKSTLLNVARSRAQKMMVVLAPTGVAALNVRGETIHSFFKFKPNVTVEAALKNALSRKKVTLFRQIDTFIIDEISMVRADLLDCVDVFLRAVLKNDKPFGGKQMIFIGDLFQLAPVVTSSEAHYFRDVYQSPYFFSSKVFKNCLETLRFVELETVYRQKDTQFLDLLNAVRNRATTQDHLKTLNERVAPCEASTNSIYLTATNADADTLNVQKLNELTTQKAIFDATIHGQFDTKSAPTELNLFLKIGAQVMFLNNDAQGQWVNGTLGIVKDIAAGEKRIQVQIVDGDLVNVHPHKWDLFKYVYDEKEKLLNQESLGSFTQFPIKLAWAITIHKSQGKTFDKVVIDLGRGAFASGQVYVALSRCRTLEGITLKKPLTLPQILLDNRVVIFLDRFKKPHETPIDFSHADKKKRIEIAIDFEEKLSFTYIKADGQSEERHIMPSSVTTDALLGYCLTKKALRSFRLDRISHFN